MRSEHSRSRAVWTVDISKSFDLHFALGLRVVTKPSHPLRRKMRNVVWQVGVSNLGRLACHDSLDGIK